MTTVAVAPKAKKAKSTKAPKVEALPSTVETVLPTVDTVDTVVDPFGGLFIGPIFQNYRKAAVVAGLDNWRTITGSTGKETVYPIFGVLPCGIELLGRSTKITREGIVGIYLPKDRRVVKGQTLLLALQGLKVIPKMGGLPVKVRKEFHAALKELDLSILI